MMTATTSALTLPRLARMADGDLLVREVPAIPTEREALLRRVVHGARIDSRLGEGTHVVIRLPLDCETARGRSEAMPVARLMARVPDESADERVKISA